MKKFLFVLLSLCSCQAVDRRPNSQGDYYPLVLGHRGACGYKPEHTEASYLTAVEMGVDFVEPDLVVTKDGEIILRHEYQIGETTNISEIYKSRKNSYVVDGEKIDDWFVNDFTLKELRKVRAVERLPYRTKEFDGEYPLMTFEEFIQLIQRQEKKIGKKIGIVPEIKHSTFTKSLKLPIKCGKEKRTCSFEDKVLDILHKYGYDQEGASPVIIQSFEIENLKYIRNSFKGHSRYKLLQLIDEPQMKFADEVAAKRSTTFRDVITPEGMKKIAEYADYVGLWKWYIQPFEVREKKIFLAEPTPQPLQWAHEAGLGVVVYTFRSDKENVAPKYKDKYSEYYQYFDLRVDGVFTDFAADGVEARKMFLQSNGL
ncbi:MAG: hypothetical protein A4S09_10210 [Proteobacteria bacterium SG_bin7]|nr:MAG: hypothetical protein A4S09_10210 [Proteobacteria bacterium SG_bin7]